MRSCPASAILGHYAKRHVTSSVKPEVGCITLPEDNTQVTRTENLVKLRHVVLVRYACIQTHRQTDTLITIWRCLRGAGGVYSHSPAGEVCQSGVAWWRNGRALDLRSRGRGFDSRVGAQLRNDRGQLAHTRLPRRRQSSLLYGVV